MSIPQIYDVDIDNLRDVTQSDVHALGAALSAFGKMRMAAVSATEKLRGEKNPVKRELIAAGAIDEILFESACAVRLARTPPDVLAARAKAETPEAA